MYLQVKNAIFCPDCSTFTLCKGFAVFGYFSVVSSCVPRLQHEVSLLQQQLCESRDLIHSLQSELHVYDRVCARTKADKGQSPPPTIILQIYCNTSSLVQWLLTTLISARTTITLECTNGIDSICTLRETDP